MCTRLLYAVLPAPYTKDSFRRLLQLLTDDLKSLQEPGFSVSPLEFVNKFPFPYLKRKVLGEYIFSLYPFVSASQVDWNGKKHTYRLIFTGCKGDWPFLRAAYGLNCGYNCNTKCHRCDLHGTSP